MSRAKSFAVGVAMLFATVVSFFPLNLLIRAIWLPVLEHFNIPESGWVGEGYIDVSAVLVAGLDVTVLYLLRARASVGWVLMGLVVAPVAFVVGLVALFLALGGTTGPR